MKIELLKNLIKEAVRDVLREELTLLTELTRERTHQSPTSPPVKLDRTTDLEMTAPDENNHLGPLKSVYQKPSPVVNSGSMKSIQEALQMTKASMSSADLGNYLLEETNTVEGGLENVQRSYTSPMPGIDLNQLGFLKKASTILNLADQKTKERHGG